MSRRMAAREVNDELRRGLPEGYKKKLNKNIETARKARYIIQEIRIKQLGGMSLNTLKKTSWNEIKRKIYEVHMKDNERKIVEIQERNIMKIMNQVAKDFSLHVRGNVIKIKTFEDMGKRQITDYSNITGEKPC